MSKYIFDIESNGLLQEATKMWCICFKNIDTEVNHIFLEGDLKWQELLNEATLVAGHNLVGFDLMLLEKLFGYTLPKTCKVRDTLTMSQVLNYKRFGNDGHSLDAWGKHLGKFKQVHEDWSKFSLEMLSRCQSDVELNYSVYKILLVEFEAIYQKNPQISVYLKSEQAVTRWVTRANLSGWPFAYEKAMDLYDILETEVQRAHSQISGILGIKCVAVDKKKGIVEVKKPRWVKTGFYDQHTANWFGADVCSGLEGEERRVEGPYCRVTFEPLSLDSVYDIKLFLYRHGWEPTEWNYKTDPLTHRRVQTTPKIVEEDLKYLGEQGQLYAEYMIVRSRHAILKSWIEDACITLESGEKIKVLEYEDLDLGRLSEYDIRLHGDCFTIGTPSFRSRHRIIANVPVGEINKDGTPVSIYGAEMRALFKCLPGYKIIGCDSVGNQARALAYYLESDEYTDILLNHDIHSYNAEVATSALKEMKVNHIVTRADAKKLLYATMFGGSGAKLWLIMFGHRDQTQGNQFKNEFIKSIPGFKSLVDKLENIYGKTRTFGEGYIYSIAGNRIYVDSFHKLLVYLLQATEKITCSAALMLAAERLEEAKIEYIPLIYYHDEYDFMVKEKDIEKAIEISEKSFDDGARLFNITIMSGKAKTGANWLETH